MATAGCGAFFRQQLWPPPGLRRVLCCQARCPGGRTRHQPSNRLGGRRTTQATADTRRSGIPADIAQLILPQVEFRSGSCRGPPDKFKYTLHRHNLLPQQWIMQQAFQASSGHLSAHCISATTKGCIHHAVCVCYWAQLGGMLDGIMVIPLAALGLSSATQPGGESEGDKESKHAPGLCAAS